MNPSFVILVMIDIVDSTKTTQRLGDLKMSKKMRIYDRISRGLLIKWNGLEIDRTDGYLLLFETMREALAYTMEYHKLVEKHLGFFSRVGIHAGVVIMHSNDGFFVSRGAKPIEIEGLQKSVCARIMSLAGAGQTVLSDRAGQLAISIRQGYKMADIGKWYFKGVKKPMQLYSISWEISRLTLPRGNKKVKRASRPKLTPREKKRRFIRRYVFYPLTLFSLFLTLKFISEIGNFYPFSDSLQNVKKVVEFLESLLESGTYSTLIDWIREWLSHFLY